ncbi:MAG: PilZ domain-containing protein [Candidatus Acidiferrales bacterium]
MQLDGRAEYRVPLELSIQLARPGLPYEAEIAVLTNVSERGAQAATKVKWSAGEEVRINSLSNSLHVPARVAYCRREQEQGFSVGLLLLSPRDKWWESFRDGA